MISLVAVLMLLIADDKHTRFDWSKSRKSSVSSCY